MTEKPVRIEARLDRQFWERIEMRMKAEGYSGPAELLRDLLRRWLKEDAGQETA
jgi:Arc/MetJ-type ribon-helix-helix transcriptional regulator